MHSQEQKNDVLTRLLYDMYVLAGGLQFLRVWQRRPRELDVGEEQLALNAALVKMRSLYDFFYTSKKRPQPDDITARDILPTVTLLEYTSEEIEFRKSINKWCAHMTWHRIASRNRPPTRRDAKRFGSCLLAHAKSFVLRCRDDGFRFDKTGKSYWKRFNSMHS